MKLVADVEKIKSNLTSLATEVESFSSAVSTYNGASINCPVEEISGVLNDFKTSIGEDLSKLDTSSNEYKTLVDECCSEYKANEEKTQTINVDAINSIISNCPDITSDYKSENASKLTIPEANFGPAMVDTGNETVDAIYNYLAKKGFNNAAICAILANMEHESGFDPTIDGDGGTSYGLCQWHNSRKENLKNYCAEHNLDPSSIEGQLEFLCYELETSYGGVYDALKNAPNTPQGAYDAAYIWTTDFEIPDNKYERADQRGNTAQNSYWNTYGDKSNKKEA